MNCHVTSSNVNPKYFELKVLVTTFGCSWGLLPHFYVARRVDLLKLRYRRAAPACLCSRLLRSGSPPVRGLCSWGRWCCGVHGGVCWRLMHAASCKTQGVSEKLGWLCWQEMRTKWAEKSFGTHTHTKKPMEKGRRRLQKFIPKLPKGEDSQTSFERKTSQIIYCRITILFLHWYQNTRQRLEYALLHIISPSPQFCFHTSLCW